MDELRIDEAARTATAADVEAILRLAAEARQDALTKRGGPVLVDHELVPLAALGERLTADEAQIAVVGTIDGAVIGYALAHHETMASGDRLALIDELYVDAEARAVGVGESMMDELLTWAAAQHCVGIDARALPGDRQTKNFFETFGLVARQIVVHRRIG